MNFNPEQLYTYKTLFSVRRSQTTPPKQPLIGKCTADFASAKNIL